LEFPEELLEEPEEPPELFPVLGFTGFTGFCASASAFFAASRAASSFVF